MLNAFITAVVDLTNAFRAQFGLAPLVLNEKLTEAAQDHAEDMGENDFFDHTAPDGSKPWDRVDETGYTWTTVGENIAAGYQTPESVVQGWIDSPGHRDNMLRESYTEIGIGYHVEENDTGSVNYGTYWAQVFGNNPNGIEPYDLGDGDDDMPEIPPAPPVAMDDPQPPEASDDDDDRDDGPSMPDTDNLAMQMGSDDDDKLGGDEGNDLIEALGGDDKIKEKDGDNLLRGGAGDDRIKGGKGNDWIEGGTGDDRIKDKNGTNALHGDAGDDSIKGGKGDDTIEGGSGDDVLSGKKGADTFVFTQNSGTDLVKDFDQDDGDRIDLSAFVEIQSLADVLARAEQDGKHVVFTADDGSTAIFRKTDLDDLGDSDFIFS